MSKSYTIFDQQCRISVEQDNGDWSQPMYLRLASGEGFESQELTTEIVRAMAFHFAVAYEKRTGRKLLAPQPTVEDLHIVDHMPVQPRVRVRAAPEPATPPARVRVRTPT